MIEVILQEDEHFITAGADGRIKWWRIAEIDAAEADEGIDVAIKPSKELVVYETSA